MNIREKALSDFKIKTKDSSQQEKGLYKVSIENGEYILETDVFLFYHQLDRPIRKVIGNVKVAKECVSLLGAPCEVSGNFDCSFCKNLESLEGAPERIGGNFDCSCCRSLKSLRGAPCFVGGNFLSLWCDGLGVLL